MKAFDYIRNVLFVLAVIILIATAGCLVLRMKPATVMSGSMEPTFHTGSVVFIKMGSEVKEGDPIAFHVGDSYVTHRIVGESEEGYITKGDANQTEDPWRIQKSSVDGKVLFSIPVLGYVFNAVGSKRGIIIGVALLLCLILSMFFAPPEKEGRKQTADKEPPAETKAPEKPETGTQSAADPVLEARYRALLERHLNMVRLLIERNYIEQDFYEKERKMFDL